MLARISSDKYDEMIASREFWQGKTVLLTGHTGFKGSWLALWLSKMGSRVCGYALEPSTFPSLFSLARVDERVKSVIGDIRDLACLDSVVRTEQPDIVIHMAAQALVRHSYAEPVETFATNVMGTVNVLDTIRRCDSVKVALIVTSDKCYENRGLARPYTESDPLGGADPYSSSKGCAELVTDAYRHSFFSKARAGTRSVAVASVRAGNVIGGGDWAADRIVPDVVKAISDNKPLAIRNPGATRPWQHVLDPLNGYLLLVERLWTDGGDFAEAWNFGPDPSEGRTVSWLVQTLETLWGTKTVWENDTGEKVPEAHFLALDSTKSRVRLNWEPKLTLNTALEWVVEWYQAWQSTTNPRTITEAQISRFESLYRQ